MYMLLLFIMNFGPQSWQSFRAPAEQDSQTRKRHQASGLNKDLGMEGKSKGFPMEIPRIPLKGSF